MALKDLIKIPDIYPIVTSAGVIITFLATPIGTSSYHRSIERRLETERETAMMQVNALDNKLMEFTSKQKEYTLQLKAYKDSLAAMKSAYDKALTEEEALKRYLNNKITEAELKKVLEIIRKSNYKPKPAATKKGK